jgi:hypothetical protein
MTDQPHPSQRKREWWSWVGLPKCDHDWEYMEREPGETYTGYCERCKNCGEIVQVVQ